MTRIAVRVTPNAKADQVVGWTADGALRVKIAAPPVDGRANDALLAFLASLLGLPKGALAITSGAVGRRKVVAIAGLDEATARSRLRPTLL